LHSFIALNITKLPCASAINYAFDSRVRQTIRKTAESIYSPFHCLLFLGGGSDKVKILAAYLYLCVVPGQCTVNQCFHLTVHRVVIYRSSHHNYICLYHLVKNNAHVILLNANAVFLTGITCFAKADLIIAYIDFLSSMSGLNRAFYELIAKSIRIAALSRTTR